MAVRPFHENELRFTGEKAIVNALSAGIITPVDRDLILEFVAEREATRHIAFPRKNNIIGHLIAWRRFLPVEFTSASIGDIYSAVNAIRAGKNTKGKPYKVNMLSGLVVDLKMFLLWLIENGYSSLPEKKVRSIRAPAIDPYTTTPDELFTYEEIKQMISSCLSARDRAFVATAYESGSRISEVAALTWKDVEFDMYGVKLRHIVDEKTNRVRYARLTFAAEYLAEWKASTKHPGPSARVFITRNGDSFNYDTARHTLRVIMIRAGINKQVHTHLFRKSRATHMIRQNIQESIIKKSLWGNENTKMFRHYVVLSEKDIDNEILGKAGIRRREDEEAPLLPRTCGRCHTVCSPLSDYCHKCGEGLTEEAIATVEKMVSVAKASPEVIIREYLSQVQDPDTLVLRILAEQRLAAQQIKSGASQENQEQKRGGPLQTDQNQG